MHSIPIYIRGQIEGGEKGKTNSTLMAQTLTSFFTVVIPTLVWLKLQSFLEGIHDDNNASEESNHQPPKSPTSQEQPLQPLMECRLDVDIEAFGNNHGTNTLASSPETTISETPSSSIIICTVQDSSSRWLRLRLRPNFATTSITRQHTESDSTPQRAATATTTGAPQQEPSNPIAQIFQNQELGKLIIGFLVPMTSALLNPYAPIPALERKLIFLSLSLGLVALWNGILLRQTIPRHAMAIEQLGAAFVLLAFYALVGSFLPASLLWLPLICFALVVFPFFLSYYLRRLTDR